VDGKGHSEMEIEATRPWWGIVCKGCGQEHPTAMYRGKNDTMGRFGKSEPFEYICPDNNQTYKYVGSDEIVFDYTLSS
jgi:hypothetical protein